MKCPNCSTDLRDYSEAVHESGHDFENCPVCHFPIKLLDKAITELGKFGFYIKKQSSTW